MKGRERLRTCSILEETEGDLTSKWLVIWDQIWKRDIVGIFGKIIFTYFEKEKMKIKGLQIW